VAALALLIFAACCDSSKQAGFRDGDLVSYSLPRADYLGEALRQGRLPLWDPEVGCGVDTLASPLIMAFYPPNWLHAVLSARTAMGILVAAHLLMMGLAFYAWLRELGIWPLPGLLAAGALLLAMATMAWWPHMLFSLSWLPVLLWMVDRPGRMTLPRWAGLAAAYAMLVLSGHPQLLAYVTLLLGAYVAVKSLVERRGGLATACLLAAVVGAAAAAVQLLPTKLCVDNESWRPLGRLDGDVAHYLEGGVPPQHQLVQWGRILLNTVDNAPQPRWLCSRFSCGYLGVFAPLAVLAALRRRMAWRTAWWLVAGVVGLVLCTGFSPSLVPAYSWLARLPVVGAFRTPDRLILLALLGGCYLAAVGLQRMLHGHDAGRLRFRLLVAAGVLVLIRLAGMYVSGRGDWVGAALWLGGLASLLAAAFVSRPSAGGPAVPALRGRWWLGGLLLAIVAIDFYRSSPYVCPYFGQATVQDRIVRSGEWDRTSQTLLSADDVRAMNALAGEGSLWRWYAATTYMPVMRERTFPAYRSLPYYEALQSKRHFELDRRLFNIRWPRHAMLWGIPAVPHRRLLDVCSVRVVFSPVELADPQVHGYRPAGRFSGGWAYVNERALPRVRLHAGGVKAVSDEQAAEWLLGEPDVSNPDRLLVSARSPAVRRSSSSPSVGDASPDALTGALQAPPSGVEMLEDQSERMCLRARCERACLLVISDSWAAGWRCTVDGREAPILRANYLHRAVELPAGEHEVVLTYVPPGLHAGAAVSLAALGSVVLAAGVGAWRQKRTRANRGTLSFQCPSEKPSLGH